MQDSNCMDTWRQEIGEDDAGIREKDVYMSGNESGVGVSQNWIGVFSPWPRGRIAHYLKVVKICDGSNIMYIGLDYEPYKTCCTSENF